MSHNLNNAVAVIGIDIGKNSFHVVGLDRRGAIVLRQKWSRGQIEARLANMPACLIGMEACVGAHHLSRKLGTLGHDARLMPAKYMRPYSKGQKNDFRDAEAIAEAVQRPTMKFVATKTAEQLDLQALHRVRERLVSQRTGIINQIRAFLLERGIAVRQGLRFLRVELPRLLATPPDVLSPRMVGVIEGLAEDWRRLEQRIEHLSGEITALAHQDAGCKRLVSVPGIGPIISSAMVARRCCSAGRHHRIGKDPPRQMPIPFNSAVSGSLRQKDSPSRPTELHKLLSFNAKVRLVWRTLKFVIYASAIGEYLTLQEIRLDWDIPPLCICPRSHRGD